MKLTFLLVTLASAQEPTCNDIKNTFERPFDVENDITCCNTPHSAFKRPLEHDSGKLLDPDDLMEYLRKYQKTDDVEVFAQRAFNVWNAYNGNLNVETSYSVPKHNRVPVKSIPLAQTEGFISGTFDDVQHTIGLSPGAEGDGCGYQIHPDSRATSNSLSIRLYVNGSYELVSTLGKRDTTTGQFPDASALLPAIHTECTGWPSKLVDFFKPIVQYHYNDSSIDFRNLPKASITEMVPIKVEEFKTGYYGAVEVGLSILRLFIYSDENMTLVGPYYAFINNTPRNDFRNRNDRVALVDDEILTIIEDDRIGVPIASRNARTWKDAMQIMNDLRAEAGVPLIPISSR